jgi:carboxyl-terminal processing protease
MSRTIRYVCLGALLILCAQSQPNNQLSLASFDQVWQTIQDKHWDPKLNGVDWQGARTELRPKVEAAPSPEEARHHIEALLARLGHSHVRIIPAAEYADMDGKVAGQGGTGLRFEIIGGDAVIASGPYSGLVLREVNGRRVRERIDRAKSELNAHMAIRNMLRGEPGESLELLLEDESGKASLTRIELTKPTGKVIRFGELPPMRLDLVYERLSPETGYIHISSFFDPEAFEDLLRRATTDCRNCRGMIVDLRRNPGGIGALGGSLAGWFFDQSQTLGTSFFRNSHLKIVANPRLGAFLGKLAILIDSQSGSTSEIFAGGMKDLKRARIFGRRSAGMALPSAIEKLPTGDGFQYATANYISAGGKPLEGLGVEPDVLIEPTRQQLLKGIDATRIAARQWIEKE